MQALYQVYKHADCLSFTSRYSDCYSLYACRRYVRCSFPLGLFLIDFNHVNCSERRLKNILMYFCIKKNNKIKRKKNESCIFLLSWCGTQTFCNVCLSLSNCLRPNRVFLNSSLFNTACNSQLHWSVIISRKMFT